MNNKIDGNILIDTAEDPIDYMELAKHLLSENSPERREFLIKQHNLIRKFYTEALIYKTKEFHEKIGMLLQKVPFATRERAPDIKRLVSEGKTILQMAEKLSISDRQIKKDMNVLGIRKNKRRKTK